MCMYTHIYIYIYICVCVYERFTYIDIKMVYGFGNKY